MSARFRWLWLWVAVLTPAPGAAVQAPSSDEWAVAELRGALSELLGTPRWRDARWGALVVSLDTGDTLYAQLADSALAPASNLKLLTGAAALRTLGPEYRYRTYVLSDGRVRDGVLHGDLVIYGTGDPGISARFFSSRTEVFDELVRQLREAGVTAVTGDLVGDASYFPGPKRPAEWDPRDLNDYYGAAVSALSYNENVVSVRVQAARTAGSPPIVGTIPDHSGLHFVNEATTVQGRARRRVIIIRDHPEDPVRLHGQISVRGRDVYRQLTIPDPERFFVSSFRAALERGGVELRGNDRIVETPGASLLTRTPVSAPLRRRGEARVRVLARHTSPPLGAYLEVVLKESHNLYAELVYRTLGRVREGAGSPEASARAVRSALAELRVPTDGLVQIDGSGLAEASRVSPATFVETLARMAESPLWPQFWHALPEVGVGRDLRRMMRTPADGNLRAKTGTIEGVSALSGLVRSADGERLAFSLLLNGARSESFAKRTENLVGVRLASFTRAAGAAAGDRVVDGGGTEEGGR